MTTNSESQYKRIYLNICSCDDYIILEEFKYLENIILLWQK